MSNFSDSTALVGSTGVQGLFSLVEAASISRPMAATRESSVDSGFAPGSFKGAGSLGINGNSVGSSSKVHTAMKHRRLSSTGQARRRLSDAREATSRPSPVMLQSAAAALSSLATLSLSGSPPQGVPQTGTSFASASGQLASPPTSRMLKLEAKDDDIVLDDAPVAAPVKTEINGAGISVTKTGKKRGTIFKCESCSKVYRHPSCLIKHRWEHSPHWREASKFLLSKHQQVQLLEAAAILSHLAPSASGGTSLPEDRSLWPSFLSGGLLPPPDQANMIHDTKYSSKARASSVSTSLDQSITYPTSSSVPAPSLLSVRSSSSSGIGSGSGTATSTGRSPSAGPRMHDYAIPSSGGGLTHVRPGVVGVSTNGQSPQHPQSAHAHLEAHALPGASSPHTYPPSGHRSAPVPVPAAARDAYREPRNGDTGAYSFVSGASISDAWSSPVSVGFAQSSFRSSMESPSASASFSASYSQPASAPGVGRSFSDSAGGWSLPRSSLCEGSRSPSGSVEMDGREEFVDVDGASGSEDGDGAIAGRFGFTSRRWNGPAKIEEEEWDGMEMEMEM
ncbi:transcription factor [Ganoderma sinense ZZ0214-1]|uniref:Transcription factor n=1 Tax=Ganoderma sinense ZZ0214-1 TaxID=1077348 RepID=A0A2G8S1N2_9APHY|nr:transcription factor [Ganoderma sinense ZZ0214-1]